MYNSQSVDQYNLASQITLKCCVERFMQIKINIIFVLPRKKYLGVLFEPIIF